MKSVAQLIVNALLEAEDEEDVDFRDFFEPIWSKSSNITPENAMTADTFYHRKLKYARSNEPIRARRNGKTKTWKREPGKFRIPVKYGLKECFYIDNDNAHEWALTPPQ